jgi:CHAD domain-containing protein
MAKARDVDLDPAAPFAEAARRIVAVRGTEVFEHSEGVLDTSDIERVHDMRVATRRLRAALEVFSESFAADELKPVLRDVKRLADALGERRDPDVHIEEFSKLRANVAAADQPGVDLLIESLRDEQATGNERLAAALEEMRSSDLQGRLEALAEA